MRHSYQAQNQQPSVVSLHSSAEAHLVVNQVSSPTIIPSHQRNNRWQPVNRYFALRRDKGIGLWLNDQSSLTQRLIDKSVGAFRVEVIRQQWQRPWPSECKRLQLPIHQYALVREVVLFGGDQAWVYARTILPPNSLQSPLAVLKRWDARPLGALLFSCPNVQRSAIEVAELPADDIYSQLPTDTLETLPQLRTSLWGRRSVFNLHGKPLLVSEIFLPDFTP